MTEALADVLSLVGGGVVPGRLFAIPNDSGSYPGLVPDGGGNLVVRGTVYGASEKFRDEHLRMMDAYEEYFPDDPEHSEYVRRPILVQMDDGSELTAMMYAYNRKVPADAVCIESGDFLEFIRSKGRSAYSDRGTSEP